MTIADTATADERTMRRAIAGVLKAAALHNIASPETSAAVDEAVKLFTDLRADLAAARSQLDAAGESKERILNALVELEKFSAAGSVWNAASQIRRALDSIDTRINSRVEQESQLAAARSLLRDAMTPNICGAGDDIGYAEDCFNDIVEGQNEIREVWANRTLGQWWAARVVTEWDADGDAVEDDIVLYATKAEALAAVAASEAARFPDQSPAALPSSPTPATGEQD